MGEKIKIKEIEGDSYLFVYRNTHSFGSIRYLL